MGSLGTGLMNPVRISVVGVIFTVVDPVRRLKSFFEKVVYGHFQGSVVVR